MRACVSVMYHILILSVITSDYNSQNMHEHNHRLINCSFWACDRVNYQISPVFFFRTSRILNFLFSPWLVVSLDTNSIVNVIKTKQREDGEAVTERSLITILPQSILRITLNVNLEDRCCSFCTNSNNHPALQRLNAFHFCDSNWQCLFLDGPQPTKKAPTCLSSHIQTQNRGSTQAAAPLYPGTGCS